MADSLPTITIKTFGIYTTLEHISLKAHGINWKIDLNSSDSVRTTTQLVVYANKTAYLDHVHQVPRRQRICALIESPINDCYKDIAYLKQTFPVIFTHQQHLLNQGAPFRLLHFGTNWIGVQTPNEAAQVAATYASKTAGVSFIGNINHPKTDAYRFRAEIAECLMRRSDVDCFGKGIKEVASKVDAIGPYRYSVAMENAVGDYYFSEKLIDCILLETIPVYYGCQGIGDLLDHRGILQFDSVETLNATLDSLTANSYEEMRPYALANKETVIRNNWHSHTGMLTSMIERLPKDMTDGCFPSVAVGPTPAGPVERTRKLLWSLFRRSR